MTSKRRENINLVSFICLSFLDRFISDMLLIFIKKRDLAMIFLRDSFCLSAVSRQVHDILDFSYGPFVIHFVCDIGQSAKIWI